MTGVESDPSIEADIRATVTKGIGPHAKPDKIQFTPSLPKTRSGKIMRRILRKIAEGDLDNKIETVIAPALETLKKMSKEGKKFDLIFIDADKGNYKKYYELSLNLINKKALIIFDNVLWHGDVSKKNVTDEQTNVMRKFNKYIKDDNRVEKVILPIGDGLTICRKI